MVLNSDIWHYQFFLMGWWTQISANKINNKKQTYQDGEMGWWLHVDVDECKEKIKNVHTRMDVLACRQLVAQMSVEKRRNKRK